MPNYVTHIMFLPNISYDAFTQYGSKLPPQLPQIKCGAAVNSLESFGGAADSLAGAHCLAWTNSDADLVDSNPGSAAFDWLDSVKVKSSGGLISHDAICSLTVFVLVLGHLPHYKLRGL